LHSGQLICDGDDDDDDDDVRLTTFVNRPKIADL